MFASLVAYSLNWLSSRKHVLVAKQILKLSSAELSKFPLPDPALPVETHHVLLPRVVLIYNKFCYECVPTEEPTLEPTPQPSSLSSSLPTVAPCFGRSCLHWFLDRQDHGGNTRTWQFLTWLRKQRIDEAFPPGNRVGPYRGPWFKSEGKAVPPNWD